jgi:membrane protein YqaA with SNARE-associated domain
VSPTRFLLGAVEFSMAELLGLFLAAFAAATRIPLPSEAALYG